MGNPQTFKVNDITFGTVNADVIKELILSTVIKNVQMPKIEVAWRSLLEQKTYFPVYPGNPSTPIEWTQYRSMMYEETPDVLLIPSDLMLFAKVSLFILQLCFRILKAAFVSTQACSSRVKQQVPTLILLSIPCRCAKTSKARTKATRLRSASVSTSSTFEERSWWLDGD